MQAEDCRIQYFLPVGNQYYQTAGAARDNPLPIL